MENGEQLTFEFEQRPTIKGFPELRWTGKRPYRSTQYYPAQLRETYGKEQNGWINKIFWGDNLQVMSHLLKEYRGQIDLIYIDPPFDSKADYKKKIEIKGVGKAVSDSSSFEEKQYGDIWTNDEYLQFMYERILLLRELLSDTGSIFLHCDDSRNFYLRCLLSEVFGEDNFHNEIIWKRSTATGLASKRCGTLHDTIYWYSKTDQYYFEMQYHEYEEDYLKRARKDENGRITRGSKSSAAFRSLASMSMRPIIFLEPTWKNRSDRAAQTKQVSVTPSTCLRQTLLLLLVITIPVRRMLRISSCRRWFMLMVCENPSGTAS